MELDFGKIHSTVLRTLEESIKDSVQCYTIGKWCWDFLSSNESKLKLKFSYEESGPDDIHRYLRILIAIYGLLQKKRLLDFDGRYLYDIFDPGNDGSIWLDFVGYQEDRLLWSDGVVVSQQNFLPVFLKDDINYADIQTMKNSFGLFKAIREMKLITYPIQIDLRNDVYLSLLNGQKLEVGGLLPFHDIRYDKTTMTSDELIDIEDRYRPNKVPFTLSFKYPYYRNIPVHFQDIGEKILEIDLYNRFVHDEISDDEIILLPRELIQMSELITPMTNLTVLNTDHDWELYDLMSEFRTRWQGYEFNKFTSPFPKHWLMFINKELALQEWKDLFMNDYPSIKGKPLMHDVEVIIEKLYELNWSERLCSNIKDAAFLFPVLRGFRNIGLEKAINSFKNALLKSNLSASIIEYGDLGLYERDDLVILDPFNIIDLVNILQRSKKSKASIIIPDFLYFHYRPWIRYHIMDYQVSALLSKKRRALDPEYEKNEVLYPKLMTDIIHQVRKEILEYNSKYNGKKELNIDMVDMPDLTEDMGFYNDERSEKLVDKEKLEFLQYIEVITTSNAHFQMDVNNEIYIQRHGLSLLNAGSLLPGDKFISPKQLCDLINRESFIKKLSDRPESVRDFQARLYEIQGIFLKLKNRGISYGNEGYFRRKYLIARNLLTTASFVVPRKRNDWKIICDLLLIDSNDMNKAAIEYYGRKRINKLRHIYSLVIDLFHEKGYWTTYENPVVQEEVIQILSKYNDIFTQNDKMDTNELALSIISTIINEIEFYEVDNIKIS